VLAFLCKSLALILQGENALLEFKSSFRWDLEQDRVNRSLEAVILKTFPAMNNKFYRFLDI
jgi:hypothetical protein